MRDVERVRPIARHVVLGLLCVTLAVGSGLFYNLRTYVSDWEYLRLIAKDMREIEGLLRQHRAAHGRYPSTEEGLAALGNYASRFGTDGTHSEVWCWGPQHVGRLWARQHEETGHWPGSQEEFWSKGDAERNRMYGMYGPVTDLEIAISQAGTCRLLYHGEILSPFNVPYCYQNISGGSPATGSFGLPRDPSGMFVRKGDEGVAIYCPGAERIWYDRGAGIYRAARVGLWLVCGAFAALWVGLWWAERRRYGRERTKPPWYSLLILLVVLGASLVMPSFLSSLSGVAYETAISAYRQEARATYEQIQSNYQQAGLISTETLQRRMHAARLEADLVATWQEREKRVEQERSRRLEEAWTQPYSAPATSQKADS